MADTPSKPTAKDVRTMRAEAVRLGLSGDVDAAVALNAVAGLVSQDVDDGGDARGGAGCADGCSPP